MDSNETDFGITDLDPEFKVIMEVTVDAEIESENVVAIRGAFFEVLRGRGGPLEPYEEIMFGAMRLKHDKEGTTGDAGHYEIDGYKTFGLPGNYVLLAKKMESIRRLCWGPDSKQPTVIVKNLTDQQLEKLFDHLIDGVNYNAFGAEMIRDLYLDRTGKDLLGHITKRKEVG